MGGHRGRPVAQTSPEEPPVPADLTGERRQGTLVDWNDDRGFGFIRPGDGGAQVFAHVSAFPRGRRPAPGCEVTYVESRDERGRPRASGVRYRGAAGRGGRRQGTAAAALVAAASLAGVAALVAWADRSWLVVLAYLVLSLVAFTTYAADKSAARGGQWRTPESTLHLIGVLGGWPGALVARHVLRHKTVKQPFRTVFWVTVAVNCAALAAYVLGAPIVPS